MGSRLLIKIQTVRSLYTFEPNSLNDKSISTAAEPFKGKKTQDTVTLFLITLFLMSVVMTPIC